MSFNYGNLTFGEIAGKQSTDQNGLPLKNATSANFQKKKSFLGIPPSKQQFLRQTSQRSLPTIKKFDTEGSFASGADDLNERLTHLRQMAQALKDDGTETHEDNVEEMQVIGRKVRSWQSIVEELFGINEEMMEVQRALEGQINEMQVKEAE